MNKTTIVVVTVAIGLTSAAAIVRTPVAHAQVASGICCILPDQCFDFLKETCLNAGGHSGCSGDDCDIGSCCLPDGTCLDMRPRWWCLNEDGGVWAGDGVTCSEVISCLTGACCRPNGTCEIASEHHCVVDLGGIFRGEGTTCGDFNGNGIPDTCEVLSPTCRSDINEDGEVGIVDFLTLLQDWGPCE